MGGTMACLICGAPTTASRRYCAACTEQAMKGMGPVSAVESAMPLDIERGTGQPPPVPPPPMPSSSVFERQGIPSAHDGIPSWREGIPALDARANDRSRDFPVAVVLICIVVILAAGYVAGAWWLQDASKTYRVGLMLTPLLLGGVVAIFPWRSRGKAFVLATVILAFLGWASQPVMRYARDHQAMVQAERDLFDSVASTSTVLPPPVPALAPDSSLDARAAHGLRELIRDRQLLMRQIGENNGRIRALPMGEVLRYDRLVTADGIAKGRDTLHEFAALSRDNQAANERFGVQSSQLMDEIEPGMGANFRRGFEQGLTANGQMLVEFVQVERRFEGHAESVLDMAQANLGRWHMQDNRLMILPGQGAPLHQLMQAIAEDARQEQSIQRKIEAYKDKHVADARQLLQTL